MSAMAGVAPTVDPLAAAAWLQLTAAALAILAVITWALAQAPGLSILDVPALALRISAALVIAGHIVVAAARAGVPRLRAAPGSPAGRQATRRPLRSPGHP